jgi:hypothetical protein
MISEGVGVTLAQLLNEFGRDRLSHFAQEGICEEAAAHADAPMNPPDGERNAGGLQCLVPGQDMLIDTVDQRAVEIE